MTLKNVAVFMCIAAGALPFFASADAMPQTLNQSALISANHSVASIRDIYRLQRKANWARRFLAFMQGSGGADELVLCVSDDHRAIVSQWRIADNARYLLKENYVALGKGVNGCQVWYHTGYLASAKIWSDSLPHDALAIGESAAWFEVGGMLKVNHTEEGTRFVVSRENIAHAGVTPDARMLKLFKDK